MFDTIVSDISNQFINSVLFVDEQAFPSSETKDSPDKQKVLDAGAVSRAFSEAGKICGFYAPRTPDDIEKCKKLVLKSDIVVLDWDIRINVTFSQEEESQDDETDDRGVYSLDLLKTIVEDAGNEKLKVVFIYTGEPDINGIIDDIAKALGEPFKKKEDNFEVYSDNIHILVRLKPDAKTTLTGFDAFKVEYKDLPQVLINQFSKYVNGLMPCFAMNSLAAIRDSSARVLKVYNGELDAELLGHQLALSNPDDAKSYLANSFGSAVSELIMNTPEINTDNWIEEWVDSRFPLQAKKVDIGGVSVTPTTESIKSFFSNRNASGTLTDRLNAAFSIKSKSSQQDTIKKKLSILFHKEGEDIERAKYNFAALAHHKNLFSNYSSTPKLTQGTIIKNRDEYYLCIQQRCDTARVNLSGLDFIFVPLSKNKEKHSLAAIAIAPNDLRYVNRSSTNSKMIHFSPEKEKSPVEAKMVDGKYIFKNADGEYEWVNELKELIAQRIVTEIASHYARVGVDEAEWLRLEAKDKDN